MKDTEENDEIDDLIAKMEKVTIEKPEDTKWDFPLDEGNNRQLIIFIYSLINKREIECVLFLFFVNLFIYIFMFNWLIY